MGMEGKLRQVSEFELASYRKDPTKLYDSLLSRYKTPNMEKFMSSMKELQTSPLIRRIQQRAASGMAPDEEDSKAYSAQMDAILKENQAGFADLQAMHMGSSKDGQELSLHKSWHCLHYLLTGQAWERVNSTLGKTIMGGQEIPDKHGKMGYGPARYLTAKEVREVAAALSEFPIEERAAAFDPERAEDAQVYVPNHEAGELIDYFRMLKDFYTDAAAKNNVVVLWVV